jgi:hypothetical protein
MNSIDERIIIKSVEEGMKKWLAKSTVKRLATIYTVKHNTRAERIV